MIVIRREETADEARVRFVNEQAFGRSEEADLVDRLRRSCDNALSLVAADGQIVVGHILFTPVTIADNGAALEGMGLAPMSVLPDFQRHGIGTRLVQAGIDILKDHGYPFIIVLGHPDFYPRFGFRPASAYGITPQWEGVPDEAFMLLALDDSLLERVSGVAWYHDEFSQSI